MTKPSSPFILRLLRQAASSLSWCVIDKDLIIVDANEKIQNITRSDSLIGSHVLYVFLSNKLEQELLRCFREKTKSSISLRLFEHTWTVEIHVETFETQSLCLLLFIKKDASETEEKQKNEEFIHNISHEIRTPLTMIHGYAEYLLSLKSLSKQHQRLQSILSQSVRIQHIVSSLIHLHSPDHSKDDCPTETFLIDKLIGDFLDEHLEQKQRDRIKFEPCKKPLHVRAKASLFYIALGNLLDNAFKFSPRLSKVLVKIEGGDGLVLIHIKDSGNGISPHLQSKVFERFYRMIQPPQTSLQKKGLGLGLSIAKKIIHDIAGEIHLKSEISKGSTFSIELKEFPIRNT